MNHLPPSLWKSANLWTYKIFYICGPSACVAICGFAICRPNIFCNLQFALSYGGKFVDLQFADWLTNKICGFAIGGSIAHWHLRNLQIWDCGLSPRICGFKKSVARLPLQICHRCQWNRWNIAIGINDTGGKFATSVNGGAPCAANISANFRTNLIQP